MTVEKRCHSYLRVLEPFSDEELRQIAQLKRLFEWAEGDPEFCKSLDTGDITPAYRERLKRIGVQFDVDELELLWKDPELAKQYTEICICDKQMELTSEQIAAIRQYPLLVLWVRFSTRKHAIRRQVCHQVFRVPKNPAFDAWRQRRIAAVRSELGFFGHYIDHPILSFELGDGCNTGCWFCAFAARKLTKNLDYAENRESFRQVIQTCVDLFGREESSMTLLYYGTEPHDNPHYLDFVKDCAELTGDPACTSTTGGTDAAWIRELIAFYRQGTFPWPRLSVLSKGMLLKIHELYSPDELRDVELLMQMKDHPRKKVTGGRILQEEIGLRNREEGHYFDGVVPQGSIACVSGFLTNLVHRTIQLVSPCYTCNRWPYGYRVFDETTFKDAEDYRRAMEELIARNMPTSPQPERVARLRDDLAYRALDDGFDLVSPNQVHHFQGIDTYKPLGEFLSQGRYTFNELYDLMADTHHVNPMVAVGITQKLFDEGLLDELYPA